MPGLPVIAAAIVAAGRNMSREFWDNFKAPDLGEAVFLEKIMCPDRKGVGKTDTVGWFGASPNPEFWPDGDEIPSANMDSFTGNIVHKAFGIRIPYGRDDVIYDRTGSLLEMARDTGRKWRTLDARVLRQFSVGSVDSSLYPSVPLAFDGAVMFNATDGNGNDRFSRVGGNTISGDYMDSPAEFLDGIIDAVNAASSFLDTDGQPKWAGEDLMEVVLVVPQAYAKVAQKALNQPITGSDESSSGAIAGVSNFIMTMGLKIWLYISPRYTAKQFYVYFPRVKRCFGRSLVMEPTEYNSNMNTGSDVALSTKICSIQWDMLAGHYLNLPFGCVIVIDTP
jgi:phage major head subunit gpT-like protein